MCLLGVRAHHKIPWKRQKIWRTFTNIDCKKEYNTHKIQLIIVLWLFHNLKMEFILISCMGSCRNFSLLFWRCCCCFFVTSWEHMLANACDFQCPDCTRAHILCAWYECSVSLCCQQFFSLLKFLLFLFLLWELDLLGERTSKRRRSNCMNGATVRAFVCTQFLWSFLFWQLVLLYGNKRSNKNKKSDATMNKTQNVRVFCACVCFSVEPVKNILRVIFIL